MFAVTAGPGGLEVFVGLIVSMQKTHKEKDRKCILGYNECKQCVSRSLQR